MEFPAPPPAPTGRAPNRVFITDDDLRACGYSAGCPRCLHMRAGLPCRGIKHREACRLRVEAFLREANDPRVTAADERWASRVVAQGDPSVLPGAEEGKDEEDINKGEVGPRLGEGLASAGVRTENNGPAPEPRADATAEPASAGDGLADDAMNDATDGAASAVDPMLEALLASMPGPLAEGAKSVRDLFLVSGCAPGVAQAKVVELYSPPRVTAELGRRSYPSLASGTTFDLQCNEKGSSTTS